jgi:chromosomal replication initiation ATPase DnaA
MKQLSFDFLNEDNYNINNFIVFNGNLEAYYFLNRDKEDENILDNQIIFLSGEKKCGKTHLGMIWKQKHNAKFININNLLNSSFDDFIKYIGNIIEKFEYYILDDINENLDEGKFFYLLNLILNNNSAILIVSETNFVKKIFKLKDLESRIKSAVHLKIKKLSNEIKTMLLIKLFSDKQIFVGGEVLKYLNKHLKTKYEDVYNFIEFVNDEVPEDKKKINLCFIKKAVTSFVK